MNTRIRLDQSELADQAATIRALDKQRKAKAYSKSVIRRFYPELKILKEQQDLSFPQLVLWLQKFKKISITASGLKSTYYRIEKAQENISNVETS
jgi:hypothetical protein